MMWRGTLYSTLLHGSIVIALFAGLPILPDIFKRTADTETGPPELPISIEVISADSVDLRQDVIAPSDPEASRPAPGRTTGKLLPIIVEQAVTSPEAGAATPPQPAAEKTRIPEGALKRALSDRTGRSQPTALQNRLADRAEQSPQAKNSESVRPVKVADRTAQTPNAPPAVPQEIRDDRTAQPESPASTLTALAPIVAVAARTPEEKPLAPARKTSTPRTASSADLPTSGTKPRPERKEAEVAEIAPDPSTAAGGNAFIQAVSGRKQDLVEKMLASDRRLQQAVTPRPASADIPEQARQKTMQRLQKAADAGFAHAQFNLARKFLHGEDVPKDQATAIKLLTRAARQGHSPAQSLLGLVRFTGFGVPQDQAEAAFWWSLAAEAGNDGAKTATALLKNILKPLELVQSNRLRARWGSLINDLADLSAGNTNRRDLDSELRDAAEQGDIDAVLSLLARGADADKAGEEGRNAVINAAWRGRQQIIQLLLDRGVTTELRDDAGRTPLMWAAINGHKDIIGLLIESGANPNQTDNDGSSALIRAAWNGHTSVVKSLIGAGANLNVRDRDGLTALAHARRENNTAIIQALTQAGAR